LKQALPALKDSSDFSQKSSLDEKMGRMGRNGTLSGAYPSKKGILSISHLMAMAYVK
jgi:hypothetical protein